MDPKKILESLIPFVVFGIAIALCVGLLIMFFSVAIWGLIIGAILWALALAKEYFFPSKTEKNSEGRIIEHNNEE